MPKEKNIHIRIELGKNKHTGKLTLMTYFDQNAPNFSKDEDGYFWLPTIEEKDFLNEVFELMPADKFTSYSPKKTTTEIPEKKEETTPEPQPDIEEKKPDIISPEKTTTEIPEKKEETTPEPQPDIEEKKPEKTRSIFGKKEKPDDLPPLEKNEEDSVFETTEEEPKSNEPDKEVKEEKEEDKGILVEADDQAIERALKKNEEKDESLVEADEQTIIDRVLSQKKKGKWNKGR